ncbi:putative transcription factor interactor and regulator CCHC(Zn) family [Helianthus anomalus]
MSADDRKKYKNEKMMLSLLQQAVKEDILVLLQYNGSAYSIWKALKSKFIGSQEMVKNKKSLLKKEFDLFRGLKNESTKQIIERYCNLLMNMKRLSITKDNEELIEKLADALPHETWGTYLMMLRNKKGFSSLTQSKFIEKIEAQEMEQRKISRLKDFDGEQDIGLYYKGGISDKNTNMSPKVETAYDAKSSSGGSSKGSNSKTSFSSYPSFDPNLSTTKNGKKLQCNIVLNLENDQEYSEEVAKSHMSLLGTVLESYGSFVAGRIGNPMLIKEDYDQIDAEEMELMDIKWCLASVLRRAEKFKQITGRDDFRDANVSTLGFDKSKVTCFRCREKGHFKRECTNREASGAQNPFNNNDYYWKAIYHQVAQQPHQPQTAHGKKEIEDSSKRACLLNQDDQKSSTSFSWDKYVSADNKACLINQDDEKLREGFSWENFSRDDYDSNKTSNHKAFVARVTEDSDNDDDYYAKRMEKHLKMMEESDSEDEKVRKKKKKVKTPVSSDAEEVPVIKRKVRELPAFKVNAEADAKESPVICENCEALKKQNSTLIHNLNRLKESYDVLNKAMNQYNESSEEQATTMKTLQGAFMTKQKVVDNEKCAALEIYPTVEGMKAFEEETSEEKTSEKKKDTKVKVYGKKQGVSYNKCPTLLKMDIRQEIQTQKKSKRQPT